MQLISLSYVSDFLFRLRSGLIYMPLQAYKTTLPGCRPLGVLLSQRQAFRCMHCCHTGKAGNMQQHDKDQASRASRTVPRTVAVTEEVPAACLYDILRASVSLAHMKASLMTVSQLVVEECFERNNEWDDQEKLTTCPSCEAEYDLVRVYKKGQGEVQRKTDSVQHFYDRPAERGKILPRTDPGTHHERCLQYGKLF